MPRKSKIPEVVVPQVEGQPVIYARKFYLQKTRLSWLMGNEMVEPIWIEFAGTGQNRKEAMLDMVEKAIKYFKEVYQQTTNDQAYQNSVFDNLFVCTVFKHSVINGISVAYQYPKTNWRTDASNFSFPFMGFGRSPKQAEFHAMKYLLNQYTIALRNSQEGTNEQKNFQVYIDQLNRRIAQLNADLDIFESMKAVENYREAWSEAPKPPVSEPIAVAS